VIEGDMNARRALVLLLFLAFAASATAQRNWILDERNPVIGPVEPDTWCANGRWVDSVVKVGGTYHMFFAGTAGQVFVAPIAVGHATSRDGVTWNMDPNNPVLTPAAEGDWEVTSYISSAVIHDGTEFRMWYAGSDGHTSKVGYATSPDGTTWTRYSGNPILDLRPAGSFDDTWLNPGTVILEGGTYHMWYSACGDPSLTLSGTVGYATSTDGLSWTRHPSPVLEAGTGWESHLVYSPKVVFDGTSYHLWYTGLDGIPGWPQHSSIGYATSPDGITWTKDPGNPVDELGDWVAHGVVVRDPIRRQWDMWLVEEVPDFSVHRAISVRTRIPASRRPTARRSP
jgi:sucrose-6-phosphate hydrolase SacC (GH32 family)